MGRRIGKSKKQHATGPLSIVGDNISEPTTPLKPKGATERRMLVVPVPEHIKQMIAATETDIETRIADLKIQHAAAEKHLQSVVLLKKDALLAATRAELSEKTATNKCDSIAHAIQILDIQRELTNARLEGIVAAHGHQTADMLPNLTEDGDIVLAVKTDA